VFLGLQKSFGDTSNKPNPVFIKILRVFYIIKDVFYVELAVVVGCHRHSTEVHSHFTETADVLKREMGGLKGHGYKNKR